MCIYLHGKELWVVSETVGGTEALNTVKNTEWVYVSGYVPCVGGCGFGGVGG